MENFLRINGHKFSFEEVAEKLGFVNLDVTSVALCQKVPAGTLIATASGGKNDPYPCIDLELELPDDAQSCPIILAHVEQPMDEENSSVRTYLYSRGDSYIARMDADTRPDDEEELNPYVPEIIISGEPGYEVEVFSENPYVCYRGRYPNN